VERGKGCGYKEDKRSVHPVVWRRIWADHGKWSDQSRPVRDVLGCRLMDKLTQVLKGKDDESIRHARALRDRKLVFFRNASADPSDNECKHHAPGLGAKALGLRNRWAVICMDGNDMGSQFRAKLENKPDNTGLSSWIRSMSAALDECTVGACVAGMVAAVNEWARIDDDVKNATDDNGKLTVLPIRPLIVGGDDIVVLCHVSHAITFVRAACKHLEETSRKHPNNSGLWPATGGVLTTSAGVLFCPVTYPLHATIGYAEMLLASAKGHGRQIQKDLEKKKEPSPACVDWESITESLIDTPAARRQRELVFRDEDINAKVVLTRRPYLVSELEGLQQRAQEYEKSMPRSICHQILPALRNGYWDRRVFYARVEKNHRKLAEELAEPDVGETKAPIGSSWTMKTTGEGRTCSTDLLDVFSIMEERNRMTRETIDG
jgi:Cas10/Cmr2, second palm domain